MADASDASPPSSPRKPWEADYSATRPSSPAGSTPPPTAPAVAATPDEQVATAVRFLRNPKVATAPLATKRAFLTQKGLSDAQIDEALRQVGASEADASPPTTPTPLPPPAAIAAAPARPDRRWRGWVAAGLGGGAALGALLGGGALDGWLSAAPPDKGAAAATTAPAAAEAAAPAAAPAPADASAPSPAAQRVEESLARLRQLQKPAVSTAALEAALAAPLEAHSLHTFMMIVAQQIKYPADRRYHRINTACNANFKRLAASAETRGVLAALGFVECEGGAHWKWEAAGGGSPGAAHVPQWEAAKACLQARLDNFQSVGFLAR